MNFKKAVALLATMVLFVFLSACFCCWNGQEELAEKMIESQTGGDVEMDMKEGKITMEGPEGEKMTFGGEIDDSELGIPVYPGAEPMKGASSRMEMDGKVSLSKSFVTPDSVDEVADWYESQLSGMEQYAKIAMGDEMTTFSVQPEEEVQNSVMITKNGDGKTMVSISRIEE